MAFEIRFTSEQISVTPFPNKYMFLSAEEHLRRNVMSRCHSVVDIKEHLRTDWLGNVTLHFSMLSNLSLFAPSQRVDFTDVFIDSWRIDRIINLTIFNCNGVKLAT